MSKCCDYLKISYEELVGPSHQRHLANARFMIYHVLRCNPWQDYTYCDIGYAFRRDHSSIICGINKAEKYSQYEEDFRRELYALHWHIFDTDKYCKLRWKKKIEI